MTTLRNCHLEVIECTLIGLSLPLELAVLILVIKSQAITTTVTVIYSGNYPDSMGTKCLTEFPKGTICALTFIKMKTDVLLYKVFIAG